MKIRLEVGDKVKISLLHVPYYINFVPPEKRKRTFLHGEVIHVDVPASATCQFGLFKMQNVIFKSSEGIVFEAYAGNFIPNDIDTRWIKKNKSNIHPDVLKINNV